MYVSGYCLYVCLCVPCVCLIIRRGHQILGPTVTGNYEPPYVFWEQSRDPIQEHHVILTTESSFQSQILFFILEHIFREKTFCVPILLRVKKLKAKPKQY